MTGAMGMVRCEEALARLWEFLDGELEGEQEIAVRRHLEICNRCYPQYDFQHAYFEFARRVRDKEVAPPELRRRLFQRILEEEATAQRRRDGEGE